MAIYLLRAGGRSGGGRLSRGRGMGSLSGGIFFAPLNSLALNSLQSHRVMRSYEYMILDTYSEFDIDFGAENCLTAGVNCVSTVCGLDGGLFGIARGFSKELRTIPPACTALIRFFS